MSLRVLITGAATGIGRTTAEAFLARGDRVHIADVSAEHIAALRETSPNITATRCDVSEPAEIDGLFDTALSTLGGLDVLVNNAGSAGPTAPAERITPAEWQAAIGVNLHGNFYCSRRAIPFLKASHGAIVNLSSTAGLFGFPLRTPYAAAKWALIGLTKSLAMELGEFGVRVNAICPGSVDGPRMDRVIAADAGARGVSEDAVRDAYVRQVSMRTFVTTADIANMILFLCSDAGAKISGQALAVDGHTETLGACWA